MKSSPVGPFSGSARPSPLHFNLAQLMAFFG